MQLVLLLFYRGMSPNPSDGDEGKEGYKKKEKSKKRRRSAAPSVLDDTDTALEVLADRISLWLAVAELGIGDDTPQLQPIPQAQPQKGDERSAPSLVRALWDRVLVPKFLPRETAFLSTFHSKVFGAPIPPDLVPAKKPRKPKVTHRLDPSTSTSASAAAAGAAHKMARTRSAASPPADARERDRRQLAEYVERRALARSRSASIGPARETAASGSRRAVVRAPSGKDMFKGREVGLLRRSASLVGRSAGSQPALRRYESQSQLHSQSQSQSQSQLPQSQSQSIPMDSQTQPLSRAAHSETLIMATPAKTKYTTGGSYGGGVRLFGFAAPTPIREEPSSAERPHSASTHRSFVTDTPVAHRTYSPAFVAETPRAPRLGLGDRAEDSDEDFGGLMVPTDDEDEGEDGSSMTFVPETPRK